MGPGLAPSRTAVRVWAAPRRAGCVRGRQPEVATSGIPMKMHRKRKSFSKMNGRDLTRYSEAVGSRSRSNLSTRESHNAMTHSVHQDQAPAEQVTDLVEGENANSTPAEHVTGTVEATMEENIEDQVHERKEKLLTIEYTTVEVPQFSYHHCGASKTWYMIRGKATADFGKVVCEHVHDHECFSGEGVQHLTSFWRKATMDPSNILLPKEFVITFHRACHSGFSHGGD